MSTIDFEPVETYWRQLREKQVQARMRLHQQYFDHVMLQKASKAHLDPDRFMQQLDAHFKHQDYLYQQKAQEIRTKAPLKSSL